MAHITLVVTKRVVDYVGEMRINERQIAIRDASPSLAENIRTTRADTQFKVSICNTIELMLGDTAAFWISHQNEGRQAQDFDSLYNLLARRPDVPVTFAWDL